MTGIIRKLTSLAIAFTVVCLVAASFPQFNMVFPPPVMANPDTAGENIAGAASGTNWVTPENTTSSNDVYATYDDNTQDDLQLTDFGFSIPAGAIIDGIVITREGYGTGSIDAKRWFRIGLTKDGSALVGTLKTGQLLPISDNTEDIGNATDKWGTTWTAAEINATTFGVLISDNDTTKDDLNFDYVAVTIHYRPTVFNRAATQGITITDGVTATSGRSRDVSQGITISDGVTATFARGRDISQGITVSDGVTIAIEMGRDISQTLSITATTSTAFSLNRPVSQGITISDGVTATFARGRNVSQGITISDGVTVIAASGRNISQGITISDGVTAGIEKGRDASQTLSITATTSTAFSLNRPVSQGITISDGVTATPSVYRPVAQGITVSDGVTADVGRGRNISQGITISDGVTVTAASTRNISQGITISDGVTIACGSACPVSQGITISDGVTAVPAAYRPVTQGITISDGVTVTAASGRNVSQGITISDGVTVIAGAISPVSQGITISDGVTATVTTTPTPPPPGGGGGGGGAPPPPAPPLPPGTTDVSGFISVDGIFTETVVIESVDGECGLTINEGTTGLSGEGDPLAEIAVTEMQDPPAPPENSHIIGLTYDLEPEGATFNPAITLTWSYDPDTLPEGVTEENLVIAMWDEDAGEWVELSSTVDPLTHTITAEVSHFTTFAIIAPVVPPPAPAAFSLSNLSIQPVEVQPEEAVTITVLVVNTGGMEGSYTAVLKIEGVEEVEKKVTVAAGDSRSVSFSVSREDAGSYSVVVGGLSGSFTIVALPAPPVAPALNWPLLGGAAAAVWGLLIYLGRRRISPLASATLPKLRALVALLVSVRLKIAPFTRRIISSLASTAWPKLRALVTLLMAVRLKAAPFIRRKISPLAHTAWPKLRALVALLVSVRLKIAPFIRRIISSLAHTARPKFRALVTLLAAMRLKIAPFIRRIISSLAYTAWPKLRAFVALLVTVRLKIAPFIRRIISSLISRVKH